MHDTCKRTRRPVTDIRCRARDRAGGRETAEQGRDDIGDTLPYQFLIRIVLGSRHAIGNHG